MSQTTDPLINTPEHIINYRIGTLKRIIHSKPDSESKITQSWVQKGNYNAAIEWLIGCGFVRIIQIRNEESVQATDLGIEWYSNYIDCRFPFGSVINREYWHFHKRLFERYGIVLHPGEFEKLQFATKDGSVLWERNSKYPNRWTCALKIRQALVFVVISEAGQLITALPPGGRQKTRGKWK